MKKFVEEMEDERLPLVENLLRQSLSEEQKAVADYISRAQESDALGFTDVGDLYKHLAKEETTHIGELEAMLSLLGLDRVEEIIKGAEETTELTSESYDEENPKHLELAKKFAKLDGMTIMSLLGNYLNTPIMGLFKDPKFLAYLEKMEYIDSDGNWIDENLHKEITKMSKKQLEEDLKIIAELGDYKPWSGAISTWDKIEEAGKLDELEAVLEDVYPDGIGMTELNDLLWFEPETVFEWLGLDKEGNEPSDEDDEYEEGLNEVEKDLNPSDLYDEATKVLKPEDIDHHESDLYIRKTPEAEALIKRLNNDAMVATFKDNIDGDTWYDLPFCYKPFWVNISKKGNVEESLNESREDGWTGHFGELSLAGLSFEELRQVFNELIETNRVNSELMDYLTDESGYYSIDNEKITESLKDFMLTMLSREYTEAEIMEFLVDRGYVEDVEESLNEVSAKKAVALYKKQGFLNAEDNKAEIEALKNAGYTVKVNSRGTASVIELERMRESLGEISDDVVNRVKAARQANHARASKNFTRVRNKAWRDTEGMNPVDRKEAIFAKTDKAQDKLDQASLKLANNNFLNRLRNKRRAAKPEALATNEATTNTKEINKRCQEHMLSYYDSKEELIAEIKHYMANVKNHPINAWQAGKTMVEYGTFAVYYNQVRKALMDILGQTEEEVDKYSDQKQWEFYQNLIGRNASNLISGKDYLD